MTESHGQADKSPYLEITPKMVELGVAELRGRVFGEALSEIVTDVFIALLQASPAYGPSLVASSTSAER